VILKTSTGYFRYNGNIQNHQKINKMDVSTDFSPVRITLNKSQDFDTLWGILEDSVENYEKHTIERNLLIELVNRFSGIYNFEDTNWINKSDYGVDNSQIQTAGVYISKLESKIADLEQEMNSARVNKTQNLEVPADDLTPDRQSRADWHKYTLAWAKGESLEFFDFNDPGWRPLPHGQEEWYGYDEGVAYRFKNINRCV
jgi:hypothetical protein